MCGPSRSPPMQGRADHNNGKRRGGRVKEDTNWSQRRRIREQQTFNQALIKRWPQQGRRKRRSLKRPLEGKNSKDCCRKFQGVFLPPGKGFFCTPQFVFTVGKVVFESRQVSLNLSSATIGKKTVLPRSSRLELEVGSLRPYTVYALRSVGALCFLRRHSPIRPIPPSLYSPMLERQHD